MHLLTTWMIRETHSKDKESRGTFAKNDDGKGTSESLLDARRIW